MGHLVSKFTQSNKAGWDGLAETHYRNYHTDRLLAGKPLLNEVIKSEVGEVTGKELVHLLCHIGTDTLSWALLGASVTGIDISSESLKYARKLADKMGIEADFIEADIMEVRNKVQSKYDLAFCSTGVLCWLPDVKSFAQTVRHLLNDGGIFYIYEGHPFLSALTDESGYQGNYFRKEVWEFENMGDYTDPDLKVPTRSYEWNWTMGEIVTAFCEARFRIEFLHEFPQFFYGGYTDIQIQENKTESYPCTFSLKALAV